MIRPGKVLDKYGSKTYKMELPKEMVISPIFNVKDLRKYKGPKIDEEQQTTQVNKDTEDLKIHNQNKLQAEKILD